MINPRIIELEDYIAELEAQVADLEKVLNMGIDDQSAGNQFIGEAEIDADEAGGYRCIPTAEIERVLGTQPVCRHKWSKWMVCISFFGDALSKKERACKWCGDLEITPIVDDADYNNSLRRGETYWQWEDDSDG